MEAPHIIGIFDSGVGGFSVLQKVRHMTSADIIYFGDCARAPYGNRSEAEIVSFIKDDIRFLQEKGVSHFINACNSMSVMTTSQILLDCNITLDTYTDMVSAFKNHAIFCQGERILVIGTEATIRSGAYQDILQDKGVEVFDYSFNTLAQAIEEGQSEEVLLSLITPALMKAKEKGATHILYACTHYPLIDTVFLKAQENVSWAGEFIDPAVYVSNAVSLWGLSGHKKTVFHTTKETSVFRKYSEGFGPVVG